MADYKHMEFNPPHPNLAKQLQIISSVLDTRPAPDFAKKLDQMARDPKIDFDTLEMLKEEIFKLPFEYPKSSFIIAPFPKDNLETQMRFWKYGFYAKNAQVILCTPAHVAPNREFIIRYRIGLAACWIYDLKNHISCKDTVILDNLYQTSMPLKYGFEVVMQKNPDLLKSFKNSERDKVARWIKGSQIPSMKELFGTIDEKCLPNNYIYCCEILFLACLLQKAEKMAHPFSMQEIFAQLKKNPDYRLQNTSLEAFNQYKIIGEQFVVAQKAIRKQAELGDYNFKKVLDDFDIFCNLHGKDSLISEWTRPTLAAIAKVYEGEFDSALEIFKEVLPNLFYIFNLEETAFLIDDNKTATIYQPALALGAICQNRPFLKLIKNYCIVFGIYAKKIEAPISSYEKNYPPVNKDSRTTTTEIEDWEEKAWSDSFFRYFPKGVIKNSEQIEKFETGINGPLQLNEKELPQVPIKPYCRRIFVTYKQFPQLTYFTMMGNVEAVKELANAKVDVNEMTSSRDSALLLAIHKMNLTDMPYEPELGMELFNILKVLPHKVTTLNTQTDKMKLTCLGLSVLSGNPSVVKDVLDMGADVDGIHSPERETPLYTITKLFVPEDSILGVYPSELWSPEMVDILRRRIDNFRGLSNDQIIKTWNSENNVRARWMIQGKQRDVYGQFLKYSKKEDLYKIAELLLERGANPNMPLEINGIRGYTSLMLAAESDNIKLFKMMIEHGGNPNQRALHRDVTEFSCWDFAVSKNSSHVLKYLEENRDKFK
ncbi:ankyrin repeat domain-containing protein [Fibrobacter sp. UWB7]|uniref:ankyrin repeat domain-containing protein n=1 Tax=Fibrobacter sp. UWB7 TaxID=1896206 RepID=UPI0009244701|nr:ankyrin repeat domain-containing protein [Fibrobacter sp. UWB7]SHM25409.1 Ankyrin repeat-containing protein [Fibrobacter sp. UWB7]